MALYETEVWLIECRQEAFSKINHSITPDNFKLRLLTTYCLVIVVYFLSFFLIIR